MKCPLRCRLLLAAALFTAVCAGAAAQRETWSPLKSGRDTLGFWEGTRIMEVPANAGAGLPKTSLAIGIVIDYPREGEDAALLIRMDFNRLLDDWGAIPHMKEAGMTKGQLWQYMVQQLGAMLGDVSFDHAAYSMTFEMTGSMDEFEDFGGSLQINRNKTKLKLVFDDPISLGLGDEGFKEIILDKKP